MQSLKKEYDIILVGNGTAGAGVIKALKNHEFKGSVLLIEKQTKKEQQTTIPEYNARVTFQKTIKKFGLEECVINSPGYTTVSFFSPRQTVRYYYSPDGKQGFVLADVEKIIATLEQNLPRNFEIANGLTVKSAKYADVDSIKKISIGVSPTSGAVGLEQKITGKLVLDCSGTSSVVHEQITGPEKESKIYCGVLAAKAINANLKRKIWKNTIINKQDIPEEAELFAYNDVSIAQDWQISRGAGAWAYNNGPKFSPKMKEYIKRWLEKETDPKIRKILDGKTIDDLEGTMSDIGISSIVPYTTTSKDELDWRMKEFFTHHNTYNRWFGNDWIIVPGSMILKNSPVLQPIEQMSYDNLMVIGDAAGHATPYIGEGIRPSLELGYAAGKIAIEAFQEHDFTEKRLMRLESQWWRKYGKYDIWSNAFRHLSSHSFRNKDWDEMFRNIKKNLTAQEFYSVLRSEYDRGIVWKMLSTKMFTTYMIHHLSKFKTLYKKLNLRAMDSWFR